MYLARKHFSLHVPLNQRNPNSSLTHGKVTWWYAFSIQQDDKSRIENEDSTL